jgi:hypothetical protein
MAFAAISPAARASPISLYPKFYHLHHDGFVARDSARAWKALQIVGLL